MKTGKKSHMRRRFLKTALLCLMLCAEMLAVNTLNAISPQITEADLKEMRAELLKLVNLERQIAKVPPLALDDLANSVADKHALDMVTGKFLSHCGSDGSNPYHRYSFAGGIHVLSENVSAFDNIRTSNPADIIKDLTYMHTRMHAEVPPDDGHRRNILAPHHTRVGFGIALHGGNLRLAEEYIGEYVEIEPFEQKAKPRDMIFLKGRLLNRKHILRSVDVYYEPFREPLDLASSLKPPACGLPNTFVTLRPKLSDGSVYANATTGSIQIDKADKFRVPVELFKDEPGIYTIVFWISKTPFQKPFAATNICVKSE